MVCTSCDMDDKYYVGDVGTIIEVNVCSDISAATSASFLIEKPDGTEDEWVGYVYNTTYIRYLVVDGDFDQYGRYYIQPKVIISGGEIKGITGSFMVSPDFG